MTIQPVTDRQASAALQNLVESLSPVVANLEPLVTSVTDALKVREEQATERVRINATLQARLAAIEADERVLREYFDRVFALRDRAYERLFGELDHARQSGDTTIVAGALQGIVDLARDTPLKDLLDLVTIRRELSSGHVDLGGQQV